MNTAEKLKQVEAENAMFRRLLAITPENLPPARREKLARDKRICGLYIDGCSMKSIGEYFGLNHTTILNIVRREGVWEPRR